ncbi:carbohydrate ABC transporter permease [Paenibacillus residui]|uniref:Carbohydrate ABC transporter permease n=1 Tax=Paenibacillus residui TaxID=629724 RepID=A0ABW3DCB8_9BACL
MVRGWGDKLFNTVVYIVLTLVGLSAVLPILYVAAVSVTPYAEVLKNGGYVLVPTELTLAAYRKIFGTSDILRSFQITLFVTTVGTAINLLLTMLTAYPLSRRALPHRNLFLFLVVFTMLFSGGIIPTYLVVKSTGLLDTVWALIIPSAISSFNVLIMKSFFEQLPEEIFESARMDGASEARLLLRIVVPLSTPALVTIGLFYGVAHWNQFFAAIMYITDRSLFPLQIVVRELLMQTVEQMESPENMVPTVTMQMAAVMVAVVPVVVIYPFLQKHFTKGMLLGSIKG